MKHLAFLLIIASSAATCQTPRVLIGARDTGSVAVDNIAPNPPSSFQVVAYGSDSIRVSWTAPGDDYNQGTASYYALGYSTSPISTGEMIANPSLTGNLSGWIGLTGGEEFGHSSVFGRSALGSLKMVATGIAYQGVLYPVTSNTSGSIYISAWVYFNGPNTSTQIDFYVLDQNNGVIGSFAPQVISRGAWTYLQRTITATGQQSQLRLGVQFDPGALGDTLYVDDVSMTNGVSFASTMKATGMPSPAIAGTTQYYSLKSLSASTAYYLAMTATDDKGNTSALSSVLSQTTRSSGVASGDPDTISTGTTVYYVTTGGSAGNTGKTLGSPWTLAKALTDAGSELATGYDTVFIEPGTYDVALSPARAGLYSQRIVWKRRGSGTVTIRGVAGAYQTMNVAQPYHTFDGLTIKIQSTADVPSWSAGGPAYMVNVTANYTTFKRCRFLSGVTDLPAMNFTQDKRFRAIVVDAQYAKVYRCFFDRWNMGIVETGGSPRYNTFRADTFYYHWQSAINLQASQDGSTAFHGTVVDSCIADTSLNEDNIQFEDYQANPGNTALHAGVIIENNQLGNAAENAIDMKTTSYAWISRNRIYGTRGNDDGGYGQANNMGSGPALERHNVDPGTDHICVRYNVVWDSFHGLTTTSNMQVYNNTFVNNRRTYNGPNQGGIEWYNTNSWSSSGPVEIFNNIMVTLGYTDNSSWYRTHQGSIWTYNYNMYYDSTGANRWATLAWNGSANVGTYYTTLASWRSATGFDNNSRVANPLFTDVPTFTPSGYNASWTFTPGAASEAVNNGRVPATALNTITNGTSLMVANPMLFRSSFGNPDIKGDMITIGGGAPVEITAVNYTTGIITLASARTWTTGAAIILSDYVADGMPDIGARER